MNDEELLHIAANEFLKAQQIENSANPNNEEEYEAALKRANRIEFDALFNLTRAIYKGAFFLHENRTLISHRLFPPETLITCPVIILALSLDKNKIVCAISSG